MTENIKTQRLHAKVVIAISKSVKAYQKALKDGDWGLWEKKMGRALSLRKKLSAHLCEIGEDDRQFNV